MNQSKASYYADVIFYPVVVTGVVLADMVANGSAPRWFWLLTCLLGIFLWTLVEYLLHRFILHRLPIVMTLHAMHHSRPSAYIGTPLWVSLLGFSCIAFLPLWWIGGFEIANGITCGLIIGYVWYLLIHDAVHRWPLSDSSWIRKARLRHLRHHHTSEPSGNFGVTTDFWDGVFVTKIGRQHLLARSRLHERATFRQGSNVH